MALPNMGFWEWLVNTGLIQGDPNYYASGDAQPSEYENAIRVAIGALEGASDSRVEPVFYEWLVSMGAIEGDPTYYSTGKASASELENVAVVAGGFLTGTPNAAGGGGGDPVAGLTPEQEELIGEVTGGDPEIWFNDAANQWYLVYYVPNTNVPLLYAADDEKMDALFPEGGGARAYDRLVTDGDIAQMGGIHAGTAEDPFGDPYAAFIEMLEKEALIRPWLLDEDMLAILFEAALEERQVTEGELKSTRWWKTHNEDERAWLILINSDPLTAAQNIKDAETNIRAQLEALGMLNPPEDLVAWLADKRQTGAWSEVTLESQLRALADPLSGISMDSELVEVVGKRELDTTRLHEDRVADEVLKWLGPVYGSWGQTQIEKWAGTLRNDPDGMQQLEDHLRAQRLAVFPEYENPNLSYEDIVSPWKAVWERTWGEIPDELDPLFTEIVRANDISEAGRLLREEGLVRGKDTVIQSLEGASLSTGSTIRRTS